MGGYFYSGWSSGNLRWVGFWSGCVMSAAIEDMVRTMLSFNLCTFACHVLDKYACVCVSPSMRYVRVCLCVCVSRVFHRHLIENNSSVSATRAVNERETRMSVATFSLYPPISLSFHP